MRKKPRISQGGGRITKALSSVRRSHITLGLAAALGTLTFAGLWLRTPAGRGLPVNIGWLSAGGVLVVTARTPKKGTSFVDSWSMSPSVALASATVPETRMGEETTCVSTARVPESALAPDTTYTFSYSIVMKAGETTWWGSASVAVTIGPDGSMPQPGRVDTDIRSPAGERRPGAARERSASRRDTPGRHMLGADRDPAARPPDPLSFC